MVVEEVLELLKIRLDAHSDSDLARKLGVDRRTISGWRSRGSIPKHYLDKFNPGSREPVSTPPLVWGDMERVAFRLALLRFSNYYQENFSSLEYRPLLAEFPMCAASFWRLMAIAQRELVEQTAEGSQNLETAFAILVHDDLTDRNAAASRDEKILGVVKTSSE